MCCRKWSDCWGSVECRIEHATTWSIVWEVNAVIDTWYDEALRTAKNNSPEYVLPLMTHPELFGPTNRRCVTPQ